MQAKTKTLQKHKFHIKKISRTFFGDVLFFAGCTLLLSCGQNSSKENISPTPEQTNVAIPSSAQNTAAPNDALTPEPGLTTTLSPTPSLVPEPEPTPSWTFIPSTYEPDKASLLDYLTSEEIDTVSSFSYDPDTVFQLFARYRGWLEQPDCYYCIDLIQVDKALCQMLVNIKILSSAYSFESSTVLQNLYYFVDASIMADSHDELFQITDFNNDGYNDFLFRFGPMGNAGRYSLGFVYDTNQAAYTLLGSFSSATYVPEKLLIYECVYASMGHPDVYNKYIISDAKAILAESIQALYLGNDKHSYKYQKYINGEACTVLEDVSYEEINKETDLSEWILYTNLPKQ